jgi:hypothetical protein
MRGKLKYLLPFLGYEERRNDDSTNERGGKTVGE